MTVEINLEGKVALVTGGGRRISRAMAVTLAESGADVCVIARTEGQIKQTAEIVRQKRFSPGAPRRCNGYRMGTTSYPYKNGSPYDRMDSHFG